MVTWLVSGDLISRTEGYNSLFFGKAHTTYKERGAKYGWYSNEIPDGVRNALNVQQSLRNQYIPNSNKNFNFSDYLKK